MSENKNKRTKVSEEDVFEKLKNFPKAIKDRKVDVAVIRKQKEDEKWNEAMEKLNTAMLDALKTATAAFYIFVDDLEEYQRDNLCEKINAIPKMFAKWDKESLRDSSERYVMHVELE